MHIMFTAFHVIDRVIAYGWPIILFSDAFFRCKEPYRRRTERGRHYKWAMSKFGLWGTLPLILIGWTFAIACIFTPAGRAGIDAMYVYLVVALVVDWITGSDDPPYRRWLASASDAIKKLKISPPPRSVIDPA